MPKTRQQKEKLFNDLINDLQNAKSATLSVFSRIPVIADRKLRKNLREQNIKYSVVKKTLLKKAFVKLGFGADKIEKLSGNVSLASSTEDEVAPAKLLNEFSKEHEGLIIAGGILENKWIDENKVKELAKVLSKPELIAKTLYTIRSPLNGFVNVLAGNMRGLVNVLDAIKQSKS